MNIVVPAGLLAALFLLGLAVERVRLERRRARVPLRICVTGTRGKSTVVRLVASILRESGRRVVAKTTGSRPTLIFPDGAEREIARRGPPTVLEQKRVLALAGRLGAEALVTEMMSIRPEYLAVESNRIFKPRLLLITNARLDHQEEMGATKPRIAASLAEAIPAGGAVFIPEEERYDVFEKRARARGAVIHWVPSASEDGEGAPKSKIPLFPENIRLALAAAAALGIDEETARRGMARAAADFGSLAVFASASPLSGKTWRFASIFAANEPESSARALAVLEARNPSWPSFRIALLALRADRGARTRQWLKAFDGGFFAEFSRLVFIGDGARAAARMCRRRRAEGIEISAIADRRPGEIMNRLWPLAGSEAVVVGLGNIVGVGAALVEFWSAMGERPR